MQISKLAMLAGAFAFGSSAQVPPLLTFQGRIIAEGAAFHGPGQFKFALVNQDGSVTHWLNSGDANGDQIPDDPIDLFVSRGLYSVLLGDVSVPNMAAIDPQLFSAADVRLRIWFNDGVNGFEQVSPDQRLTSSPYALRAGSISEGAVGLSELAPGVLSAANISGVFGPESIPSLDASKLGSGTLDEARLPADVAFQSTHLAGLSNAVAGTITALQDQIALLQAQVQSLSNQVSGVLPSGTALVSTVASDPALLGQGYSQFSTIPAPIWQDGAELNAPAARSLHSTVWTGNELMVWGGLVAGGQDSAQGGIYNPATDQWKTISTLDAPLKRSGHSAVWTGTEMILWGGFSTAGGYLQSGARLPASGVGWAALNTSGAPEERDRHSAIWTGERMLVWGGRNFGGILADGAVFDPADNSWTSLALPNSPEGRFDAAAVWAGDRVLIWGGQGETGSLDTGAQLLFSGAAPSAWSAMTTDGAPEPRTGHSAVWTGTHLLVWGGKNGGAYFNNGAAYNPLTDSWSALSALDAPAGRANAQTAWTGTEMIIWGGENAGGTISTGAAYNPASGTWRTLSNGGAPTARAGGSSVWTGSKFVIFGGTSGGQPIAALELLDPQPAWHMYRKL